MARTQGAIVLFLALSALGCPGQKPAAMVPPKGKAKATAPERVEWRMSKSGLGFRLSNAEPAPEPPAKLAAAVPLDAADLAHVQKRMPRLAKAAKKTSFALREKSMPAPRPGQTLRSSFPPPVTAPPVAKTVGGALSLSRWAPEGDVPMAPSLSVTFSQPMVPITAHHDLAAASVPVKLSPQPPGKWRWVGTQTLVFDPEDERFPMSGEYRVEVPAGTRSVSGAALAQAKSWTFRTPTLKIEERHPSSWGDPSDLEPLIFAKFNQKIDRSALLSHLSLQAGGEKRTLRLASEDEIEKSPEVRGRTRGVEPDRFIVVRATEPLPKASQIVVRLERGAKSAEGPRPTDKAEEIPFRTYSPLAFDELSCGWYEGCPPLAAWRAELNNPIDTAKFDRSMITVEPELADMKVDVSGRVITIRGRSKGRTRYTVTLGAELGDTFGQTLGEPVKKSIQVGEAEPMLFPEQNSMLVLDPAFEPKLSVYSVNRRELRVRLYAVSPRDWQSYWKFRRAWDWDQKITQPPGKLVATKVLRPKPLRDELVETQIDLGPALKNGFGQVIAIVEPPVQPKNASRWDREWVRAWVQVTKLGLGAFVDADSAWLWTTKLADGAPLAGVEIGVLGGQSGRTRADGIGELKLSSSGNALVAKQGDDLVFVPGGESEGTFVAQPAQESVKWFVFDDRSLYKPGERVNAKGWVRVAGSGRGGDIEKLRPGTARSVRFVAYEPRGNEIAKGEAPLDADGGFNLAFDVPKSANLGQARIRMELDRYPGWRSDHDHGFQIEEFRRPEFEVSAETTVGPHYVGKHAIATLSATYYAGGGLGNSEVLWAVRASDAYYAPPNRAGWSFGKPRRWSWWRVSDEAERTATETWPAETGPGGQHRLRIDFDALDPAYPRQLALEGTVTDVNRQSWTAKSELIVHPANVTVGLRSESRLVTAGQNIALDAIVTDIDGKTVTGRSVTIESARIETTWRGSDVTEKKVDTATCNVTSAAEPARCSLATKSGGLHRVTAIVTDSFGRKSQTQIELWVLGDDPPQNPELSRGKVEVLPDKTEYRAGDTAELFLVAPFAPAEGVLTLRRQGVVELRRFSLQKRSQTVKVKLDPAWLPNVTARVDLVGSVPRENERGDPDDSLPKRPAFATGEVSLSVPPKDRSLSIDVEPSPTHVDPGAKTTVSLLVKDARGNPVPRANLALVVVDESVLALAGYELPDPLEVFYTTRPEGVRDFETRLNVALSRPDTARMQLRAKQQKETAKYRLGSGGGDGIGFGYGAGVARGSSGRKVSTKPSPVAMASAAAPPEPAPKRESRPKEEAKSGESAPDKPSTPIAVRKDFSALATFVPRIVTDDRGRARIRVKLPDSLTRYRVMAVAASGDDRFGSAESAVTARLPLMVRPSLPRFLNFGDRFQLPVVLQNQTARPMSVDVALRTDNAPITGPAGLRVTVPASDRVEVRFPTSAGSPGTARFQVAAISGGLADAAENELPIWTPATTEAFATYGQVDQGAVGQQIRLPSGVFTQFGGLEITTTSTQLQGLTDALLYLVRYPFECNEQISSRVLSIAALKDVLGAFRADEMPSPKQLSAFVAKDIERLRTRQHWSGGWDWWRKDREAVPFVSVHVTHALVRAKQKGFKVPPELLANAIQYLRLIRQRFPAHYPPWVRREIESYAIYVRAKNGDKPAEEARRVIQEAGGVDKLSLDALGFLLSVMSRDTASQAQVEAIRRHIDNRVTETAGKAHFVTNYDDGAHLTLGSSRRTDGILLEATIDDRPESDLIPKLVAGLLGHRKRGRWLNTQENVFILLALDRYFDAYEKATPDFVARAWLGGGLALEHRFKGRSTDRQHVDIPLTHLAKKRGAQELVIAKDGTGRLYYRVGMQYAPKDLRPPPAEHGFSVSRKYEHVDKPGDVRRERDGSWRIKAGALVRVRVTMVAPARRYHVALVDPLPAGLEPLNSALATTRTIPQDPKQANARTPWWWSATWYEHQNLRDERVEAFASLLWDGVYDYTYVARATTPGEFIVPPSKAEEMYDPETFGRGAADRVIVE